MANSSFVPAKSSQSRVFLIEGRARPDHTPSYQSCMRLMGLDYGQGDIERVECPDPYNYDRFIERITIRGSKDRPTTSLEGRFPLDTISTMLRLAKQGCAVDVQLHLGQCTDPSIFDKFKKALILEQAELTNYGTDELGALVSGDNAAVNETLDVSAKEAYEVVPLTYTSEAGSIITNEIGDVVLCDSAGCGECAEESDGCKKIFAISILAGGSPGTPPDIVYSIDKGVTWYAHDIEGATTSPNEIDCLGLYLVVVFPNEGGLGSLYYALKSEMDGVTDPTWTAVTTGLVAGGRPRAIWSAGNYAFIGGGNGYMYGTDDPLAGVTVLSPGIVTADNIEAIHGLSDTFAVAVGVNGTVIYTQNGTAWTAATTPTGIGVTLLSVFVKSEREWWVGTATTGQLYYTLDGGVTWTLKAFPGSGSGNVRAIHFATDSIGFLAHSTTAPRGRILRTYNGGKSWVLTPEDTGSLPLNDRVNALAVCSQDPNFVVGVGLADDGSDGFIAVGRAV